MKTADPPTCPILYADPDDTYGYEAHFESLARDNFLIVHGARVVTNNTGEAVRIYLKSDRQDFEGDSFYLLDAEMVVGKTTWIGHFPVLEGVLVKFCYRTEDELLAQIEGCPSGDGIYVPKSPMPDADMRAWRGEQVPSIQCRVALYPRRESVSDGDD